MIVRDMIAVGGQPLESVWAATLQEGGSYAREHSEEEAESRHVEPTLMRSERALARERRVRAWGLCEALYFPDSHFWPCPYSLAIPKSDWV